MLSITKFSAMQVRGKDCYATGYGHDFSDWEADPFDEGDYDMGTLIVLRIFRMTRCLLSRSVS